VATWHEREHQRAAAAVLPQRHRPVPLVCPGDRSRRSRAEHQTPKITGLEDPSGSL